MCSLASPLHESLIVSTNREEVCIIAAETDTHHMLGVTSKRDGQVTLAARVAEEVNQTIIITSGYESTIVTPCNMVNMSAICARGEDSINRPTELGCVGGPLFMDGV